jgi:RNA polymerase-binding transcription factor DksA
MVKAKSETAPKKKAKKAPVKKLSKKVMAKKPTAGKLVKGALIKKAGKEAVVKKVAKKAVVKKAVTKTAIKKAAKKAVVKKAAKKAVVKKAAKTAVVKKAVKKAVVKKAVKRAVVKKAAKKAIVKKAVKRAVVEKAVKKAIVKSAVRKALVRKALERAIVDKVIENTIARQPMGSKRTVEPPVVIVHKKMPRNKKVKYTIAELKHFRGIILEEQRSILESARANMAALVDNESGEYKGDNLTYASHMAEQGTDEMEREKNYMFVQRDEKYLGYLQDALIRIDQGTYGICVDCKDEPKNLCKSCPLIPKERLEVVPITTHCIECKNLRGT